MGMIPVTDPVAATMPRSRPGVPCIPLRVHHASASIARRFVADVICGHVRDADHAHWIVLAACELVTNALAAAEAYAAHLGWTWAHYDQPVRLGVGATDRYVHLAVRDPDPAPPVRETHDPLDEHGRGLTIVETIAARLWYEPGDYYKTARAVIAAPGVTLTDRELA